MTNTDDARLLVALASERQRERLIGQLLADGFALDAACAAREAQLKARQGPDLLLLGELEFPGGALGLLRAIRAGEAGSLRVDPALPVLVLLQNAGQLGLLRAFEAGADDVLRAPVSYLELRARVCAVLGRTRRGVGSRRRRVGALAIDPAAREVRVGGRPVALARMEYELLVHLAVEPSRVYRKHELLRDVWGYRLTGRTRTVAAHACRLRRRLADAGAHGYVVCVRGVGYRLLAASEAQELPIGASVEPVRCVATPERSLEGAA